MDFLHRFCYSALTCPGQPQNHFRTVPPKKGGCSFESLFEEEEVIREIGDDIPIPYPGKVEAPTSREELSLILKEFKKVTANIDDGFANRQVVLKNGNSCFKKDEKWGLKSEEGKILLKPQFDYIFSDTLVGGFLGYTNGKCNYYDEKGKPLLRENYYHISPLDRNAFVVRTLEGVGLIVNGEMVVEPDKETIQRLTSGNTIYYKIKSARKGEYLLLNDFQTEVPFPAWETAWFSGEDYIVFRNNILDLKNKEPLSAKRIMFLNCSMRIKKWLPSKDPETAKFTLSISRETSSPNRFLPTSANFLKTVLPWRPSAILARDDTSFSD